MLCPLSCIHVPDGLFCNLMKYLFYLPCHDLKLCFLFSPNVISFWIMYSFIACKIGTHLKNLPHFLLVTIPQKSKVGFVHFQKCYSWFPRMRKALSQNSTLMQQNDFMHLIIQTIPNKSKHTNTTLENWQTLNFRLQFMWS